MDFFHPMALRFTYLVYSPLQVKGILRPVGRWR